MSDLPVTSPNFAFLSTHDGLQLKLASQAELFCYENPDLCLTRLRQLAEAMTMDVAIATGGLPATDGPPELKAVMERKRRIELEDTLFQSLTQYVKFVRRDGWQNQTINRS